MTRRTLITLLVGSTLLGGVGVAFADIPPVAPGGGHYVCLVMRDNTPTTKDLCVSPGFVAR